MTVLFCFSSDLVNFVQTHYTAPRMIVVGAGAVSHQQLTQLADKSFGSLPAQSALPVAKLPCKYTGSGTLHHAQWGDGL